MINPYTLTNAVYISASDEVSEADLSPYNSDKIGKILTTTLEFMNEQMQAGLILPYFADIDASLWTNKPKTLDIYVTDLAEGQALNLEARGKDYATNILSYPSDLPPALFAQMEEIPLGELIICHAVLEREAKEQGKTVPKHLSHLLVHGILHLLGFDHELGQTEQDEMEGFEIGILQRLDIGNPYD